MAKCCSEKGNKENPFVEFHVDIILYVDIFYLLSPNASGCNYIDTSSRNTVDYLYNRMI